MTTLSPEEKEMTSLPTLPEMILINFNGGDGQDVIADSAATIP